MPELARIFIYPIKSTAPVELEAAMAHERGLVDDRRYVVTDHKGRFLTARRFPQMLRINARPTPDGLSVETVGHEKLSVRVPEFTEQRENVAVWKDNVAAQPCGAKADAWFSEVLGTRARLFYMSAQSSRPARGGGEVSFADGAPILVISEESLTDLNTRLETPVDMRRFRPNLVVKGCKPYAEDQWPDFRLGDAGFRAGWKCARCIMTTIDPDTFELDPQRQPLDTLMAFRGDGENAYFGLNVGVNAVGRIQVGDNLAF